MNEAHADFSAPGPAGSVPPSQRRGGGWTLQRWLTIIVLVFAAQVILVFILGERHFPAPLAVTNAPQLTLADSSSDLIALDDPTLFALPHASDFAPAIWGQRPVALTPFFPRTEPALPPLLAAENLGADFIRFMQTNILVSQKNDFKPAPQLSDPALPLLPAFAANSSLRIEGELAQRKLLNAVGLTNWPYADVIAPSKIQVLVDKDGGVVSAILLPSDSLGEAASHYTDADQFALKLANGLRFAPAARLTVGQLIFNWCTVAPPATNSLGAAP